MDVKVSLALLSLALAGPAWRMLAVDTAPSTLQSDTYSFVAHQDPNWDSRSFNLDTDFRLPLEQADAVHAIEPDLSAFKARGGKLLPYHGWIDPGPSPVNTLNYYASVLDTMGAEPGDWLRAFMMPRISFACYSLRAAGSFRGFALDAVDAVRLV